MELHIHAAEFMVFDDSPVVLKDGDTARRHVLCQVVGAGVGLAEDFGSAGCMNNNRLLLDASQHQRPSAHDFERLASIHAHVDDMRPDLVATSLIETPRFPLPGETITVEVIVQNFGNVAVGPSQTRIDITDVAALDEYTEEMLPGGALRLTRTVTIPNTEASSLAIEVTTDVLGEHDEMSEGNVAHFTVALGRCTVNDDRSDACEITELPFANGHSVEGYGLEFAELPPCGVLATATAWYRYTHGGPERTVRVTTRPGLVAVHDEDGPLACPRDAMLRPGDADQSFVAHSGRTYWIQIAAPTGGSDRVVMEVA